MVNKKDTLPPALNCQGSSRRQRVHDDGVEMRTKKQDGDKNSVGEHRSLSAESNRISTVEVTKFRHPRSIMRSLTVTRSKTSESQQEVLP